MEKSSKINSIYTITRIKPESNLESETIIEFIKELSNKFNCIRVEFDADVYEAQFDFDKEKAISLIQEYPEFRLVKLLFINENEICFGRKDNFIYLYETSNYLRNYVFEKIKICWAFTHDNLDYQLQTSDNPNIWEINKKQIPSYVELLSDPLDWQKKGKMIINTESLPGHEHIMRGTNEKLWFGSVWQMHFSEIYYSYIPQLLWDSYVDCEENVVLSNSLRRITLYKNPNEYELEANRLKQWNFRKLLGLDTITHELSGRNLRISSNLPIIVSRKNCKHGQIRVTKFFDKNKKLVHPDIASHKEIFEFSSDGKELVFEEHQEI